MYPGQHAHREEENDGMIEYIKAKEYLHVRGSFLSMPSKKQEIKKIGIPIFLSITPIPANEPEVKVIDKPVPRCHECKAYLNPQCEVIPPGYKWKCSICRTTNDLTSPLHSYGASLRVFSPNENAENNRHASSNPILTDDVLSFYSGADNLTPPPPIYLFAIECSAESIERGVVYTLMEQIPKALECLDDPYNRAQISIILFSDSVRCVRLEEATPVLDVINEVDKTLPLLVDDYYILPLKKVKEHLPALLQEIERIFSVTPEPGNNFGLVLRVISQLIHQGGHITAFLSTPPSVGEGNLVTPGERKSASSFYSRMTEEFLRKGISLSLFVLSSKTVEVPSLLDMIESTGGEIRYYPAFLGSHLPDTQSLFKDISTHLYLTCGTNCFLRIRASDNIHVKKYWGVSVHNDGLIRLPLLRKGKTFSFEAEYDADICMKGVTFQIAIIYTTNTGVRIVRTINHSIEVGPTSVDPLGIVHAIALYALDKEKVEKGTGARLAATMASDVLACVGMNGIMRLFPHMIYGLIKNKVFKSVSSDLRGVILYGLRNSPMKLVDSIIYPTLVRIDEEIEAVESESVILPSPLPLSSAYIGSNGTYFLDSGIVAYLFTGDASGYRVLDETEGRVFIPNDKEYKKIRNVMDYMMCGRTMEPTVYSVHQTGHSFLLEGFQSMLIEDGASGISSSYSDFLHRLTSRGYTK
ncbi:protein transport protein SEC24 [Nematocida sp. LUAm3]|nr:protein transport protein SEC24 [Nematocida sp. LUAm3]KAI5174032.1 protein transport protein SEC24 [Nematocida sp. LUAm2]KAI5177225.1 protein transport protein SEC24 [Nematocida sp. LUAm1]